MAFGGFALATGLACGAAPESVCGHMQGLARAESKVGEQLEFPLEQCTKTLETQRERLGAAAWATKASCILSAASLVAVDAC